MGDSESKPAAPEQPTATADSPTTSNEQDTAESVKKNDLPVLPAKQYEAEHWDGKHKPPEETVSIPTETVHTEQTNLLANNITTGSTESDMKKALASAVSKKTTSSSSTSSSTTSSSSSKVVSSSSKQTTISSGEKIVESSSLAEVKQVGKGPVSKIPISATSQSASKVSSQSSSQVTSAQSTESFKSVENTTKQSGPIAIVDSAASDASNVVVTSVGTGGKQVISGIVAAEASHFKAGGEVTTVTHQSTEQQQIQHKQQSQQSLQQVTTTASRQQVHNITVGGKPGTVLVQGVMNGKALIGAVCDADAAKVCSIKIEPAAPVAQPVQAKPEEKPALSSPPTPGGVWLVQGVQRGQPLVGGVCAPVGGQISPSQPIGVSEKAPPISTQPVLIQGLQAGKPIIGAVTTSPPSDEPARPKFGLAESQDDTFGDAVQCTPAMMSLSTVISSSNSNQELENQMPPAIPRNPTSMPVIQSKPFSPPAAPDQELCTPGKMTQSTRIAASASAKDVTQSQNTTISKTGVPQTKSAPAMEQGKVCTPANMAHSTMISSSSSSGDVAAFKATQPVHPVSPAQPSPSDSATMLLHTDKSCTPLTMLQSTKISAIQQEVRQLPTAYFTPETAQNENEPIAPGAQAKPGSKDGDDAEIGELLKDLERKTQQVEAMGHSGTKIQVHQQIESKVAIQGEMPKMPAEIEAEMHQMMYQQLEQIEHQMKAELAKMPPQMHPIVEEQMRNEIQKQLDKMPIEVQQRWHMQYPMKGQPQQQQQQQQVSVQDDMPKMPAEIKNEMHVMMYQQLEQIQQQMKAELSKMPPQMHPMVEEQMRNEMQKQVQQMPMEVQQQWNKQYPMKPQQQPQGQGETNISIQMAQQTQRHEQQSSQVHKVQQTQQIQQQQQQSVQQQQQHVQSPTNQLVQMSSNPGHVVSVESGGAQTTYDKDSQAWAGTHKVGGGQPFQLPPGLVSPDTESNISQLMGETFGGLDQLMSSLDGLEAKKSGVDVNVSYQRHYETSSREEAFSVDGGSAGKAPGANYRPVIFGIYKGEAVNGGSGYSRPSGALAELGQVLGAQGPLSQVTGHLQKMVESGFQSQITDTLAMLDQQMNEFQTAAAGFESASRSLTTQQTTLQQQQQQMQSQQEIQQQLQQLQQQMAQQKVEQSKQVEVQQRMQTELKNEMHVKMYEQMQQIQQQMQAELARIPPQMHRQVEEQMGIEMQKQLQRMPMEVQQQWRQQHPINVQQQLQQHQQQQVQVFQQQGIAGQAQLEHALKAELGLGVAESELLKELSRSGEGGIAPTSLEMGSYRTHSSKTSVQTQRAGESTSGISDATGVMSLAEQEAALKFQLQQQQMQGKTHHQQMVSTDPATGSRSLAESSFEQAASPDGNVMMTKKTTRVLTSSRNVHDTQSPSSSIPLTNVSPQISPLSLPAPPLSLTSSSRRFSAEPTSHAVRQTTLPRHRSPSGSFIRLKVNKNMFEGFVDHSNKIMLEPLEGGPGNQPAKQ